MHGQGRYKFKIINGVLSWKNDEMERFMPVSPEILTRVILLYEKEFKNGLRIWNQLADNSSQEITINRQDPEFQELSRWMDQLEGIFSNMDPYREKEKWMNDQIYLN